MSSANESFLLMILINVVVVIYYQSKCTSYKNRFLDAKRKHIIWLNKYNSKCQEINNIKYEMLLLNSVIKEANEYCSILRKDISVLLKEDTPCGDHAKVLFKYTVKELEEQHILYGDEQHINK